MEFEDFDLINYSPIISTKIERIESQENTKNEKFL